MPAPPALHDLACVIHLHSVHSDGTGTVHQIAAAARRAGVDVVLLTDHDTLGARDAGEEGWDGRVLVLVGTEITPPDQNHFLAFGVEQPIPHRGLDPAGICASVSAAGGFGFAAHPFSRGSERFRRPGPMPWRDIDCEGLTGIELWSFLNDTGERLRSVRDVVRFVATPERVVDHPPEENLREWDRICRERPVVGVAGLDAHQFGVRMFGQVPLRLMGYARSFRQLRTHVLLEETLSGELEHDRELVYSALREGRCYMTNAAVARAHGFSFWAEWGDDVLPMGATAHAGGWTLHTHLPRTAVYRLFRDGDLLDTRRGENFEHPAEEPGVYRVEARIHRHGRERTWILSNPIYLR